MYFLKFFGGFEHYLLKKQYSWILASLRYLFIQNFFNILELDQQLALIKNPMNPQLFMLPSQTAEPQLAQKTPPQPEFDQSNSKVLFKIELMNEKLENLRTMLNTNQQALPNMETNVLLSNITRIVKENEQQKKV